MISYDIIQDNVIHYYASIISHNMISCHIIINNCLIKLKLLRLLNWRSHNLLFHFLRSGPRPQLKWTFACAFPRNCVGITTNLSNESAPGFARAPQKKAVSGFPRVLNGHHWHSETTNILTLQNLQEPATLLERGR